MPEHLGQGSKEPALLPGKLRLYGMRFCPYDHRAHLVLIAKNIPHDNVFINLKNKPEWYKEKIRSTKVPGLYVDGQYLFESLIIADFLDEKFPQRPLHSKDPFQKAKDRILIEDFGKVTAAFFSLLMSRPGPSPETFEAMVKELVVFDQELAERGTKYFGGAEPGMLDYMIWPWFERFSSMKIVLGSQFELPEEKLKHLVPWVKAMEEDRAVKEYLLSPDVYVTFLKGYMAGEPDYNIPV